MKVPGFTKTQRTWFLERDDHRCSFLTFENGLWRRCENTKHLQVHHVLPRGLYAVHFQHRNWDVNNAFNGITLCAKHHVCYGEDPDTFPSVHPDTERARLAYIKGNKQAYKEMAERRAELNAKAIPYWNTSYDWIFYMIILHRNRAFPHLYPARLFPPYTLK